MKKRIVIEKTVLLLCLFSAFFLFCFFTFGCGTSQTTTQTTTSSTTTTISVLSLKAILPAAGASAVSSTEVKELVLVTQYSFRTVEVTGTDLNVDISYAIGQPLGVLFIDASGALMGTLNLTTGSGDLDILPLTKISSSEIYLGRIKFSSRLASPETDPISAGGPIDMTATEKAAVAGLNNILSCILRYPDINQNGIVDFLENKYFRFGFDYGFIIGTYPSYESSQDNSSVDITPDSFLASHLKEFKTYVHTLNSDSIDTAWGENPHWPITFPATYTETHETYTGGGTEQDDTHGHLITMVPTPGTYEVESTTEGTLYFNVEDQGPVLDSMPTPVPVFTVSGGSLESISWTWHMRNTPTGLEIDPTTFLDHFNFRINNEHGGSMESMADVYDSPSLSSSVNSHTLTSPAAWVDCDSFSFTYYDKFGNMVFMQFYRPWVLDHSLL